MRGPIVTIVGARPNFMKAAPVHRAFEALGVRHEIIHTGQHYDDAMSKVFFEDLGMPRPSVYLGVGSGSHAVQTANVMIGLEKVFLEKKPAIVNVVGDVNSTMAAAIVAAKLLIPVAHIEAGLRSRDWTMPEEVNRAVTDVVSDLLLTPSPDADANLRAEGRDPSRIVCVGNVMIDTLFMHLERARALDMPTKLLLEAGNYAVLTLHRPSNVDDPVVFARLIDALLDLQRSLPIVFPVHPRTRARLRELGLATKLERAHNITLLEPLGYLEFLSLTSRAKLVLTDSGGLQEETTALGIPCLTLRENTERPITVDEGTNTIVGTDAQKIRDEAAKVLRGEGKTGRTPALWDGKASERIAKAVLAFLESRGAPTAPVARDAASD
ncbi:UDP-N-acetylglucosamine 2-epimerase (non-hydrolyzing) [Myxococcota bacterium]|nr:UDP-N-acetylglucosamine 2-epimerase (non-hydrolyzing) [Myxococcota bacterium]